MLAEQNYHRFALNSKKTAFHALFYSLWQLVAFVCMNKLAPCYKDSIIYRIVLPPVNWITRKANGKMGVPYSNCCEARTVLFSRNKYVTTCSKIYFWWLNCVYKLHWVSCCLAFIQLTAFSQQIDWQIHWYQEKNSVPISPMEHTYNTVCIMATDHAKIINLVHIIINKWGLMKLCQNTK